MKLLDEVRRTGFSDYREFVNPMVAQRTELTGEPARVVHTDKGRLVDANGNVFEDFHGTQSFGHRHPAIAAAVRAFLETDEPNWYPARVNPYAGALARKICERTGYSNVFFAGSGTEGVEATLKLARAATRRPRILSIERAYHGCTFGSCGLMSPGPFREPFAPHLPGLAALPFGDLDAAARAIGEGDVAAVVVEPLQLEGGVRPLPARYVEGLCELTARHSTLLVADEIQTGLGRTGRFLRSETWPRRPDCVVVGKHFGGGLVPLSAMLTRRELFERAYGADYESAEAHNTTFGGSALVCVAGLATLELITDDLVARIGARGDALRNALGENLSGNALFREIRGEGFIVGIQLEPTQHPWLSFEHFGLPGLVDRPSIGPLLCHRLYRRGFFCFVCGHDWSVLRVLPRFDVEESTLDAFVRAAREELEWIAGLE
jgi:acetylornithine/succinyldiaminopimelate/putrescine aminotransferase